MWRSCWACLDGFLPEGPQLFPEEMVTDQPERQVMAEILREKLLLLPGQGDPHGTAVEITTFLRAGGRDHRRGRHHLLREGQPQGIIIGKGAPC